MIIECWSCGAGMTLAEHGASDGYCPECEVEIDLAELFPKLMSERDALAAELSGRKHRNGMYGLELTNEVERRLQAERRLHEVADHCATVERELATLKAGDGEQKPYAYSYGRNNGDGTWSPVIDQGSMVKTGENKYEYGPPLNACLDCPVIPLFTTPQPVQDVSGLVSALELAANRLGRTAIYVDFEMRSEIDEWEQEAREALAKFAQGGGNV